MRKILLASVSAIVLNSSAAMSADMPVKARPLPAPVPAWTGFYVGLNAGYAWGNSDPTLEPVNLLGPPFFFSSPGFAGSPPSLNPNGFIGGGQAGYNWQIGQWVLGGEVDFSALNAKAEASLSPFFLGKGVFPGVTGTRTVTWSSRYNWLLTARLRGGFLVAPNWLLYATGGLAVTRVKDSVVCTTTAPGSCGNFPGGLPVTWSDSETLAGGTIGGGIETMFAPNWTARVEYLYAKFKDTTPPVASAPTPFPPIVPVPSLFSFNHDLNVVRFAINYKFAP